MGVAGDCIASGPLENVSSLRMPEADLLFQLPPSPLYPHYRVIRTTRRGLLNAYGRVGETGGYWSAACEAVEASPRGPQQVDSWPQRWDAGLVWPSSRNIYAKQSKQILWLICPRIVSSECCQRIVC